MRESCQIHQQEEIEKGKDEGSKRKRNKEGGFEEQGRDGEWGGSGRGKKDG